MHKIIGVLLLVAGTFLVIRGYDASRSVDSQLSNLLGGSSSHTATWLYIGGAACCAVGLVEIFRPSKS
jgi:drug/metabolite transporter (DMT)-like permease